MIYAVYRCLYGSDFIKESIESIDPYVDKIFVFWDSVPWGDITSVKYRGQDIKVPKDIDGIVDAIKLLNNPKVYLEYNHMKNNINQFTVLINERILPFHDKPNLFMIIEVDHVFREDQLVGAIRHSLDTPNTPNQSTYPIELWKHPTYRTPQRNRLATIFWNMAKIEQLPPTGRQADGRSICMMPFFTHNFGFCFSEHTMYYKHLLALGFADIIRDSPPNEDWFDRWKNWKMGDRDLEPSKRHAHHISEIYPYPVNELPKSIIRKYGL